MADVTLGGGRRTGTAAAALALALGVAACPAGAAPLPKHRTASAAADGPDVPARVTVGPGGRDLHLAGDLTAGVAARVAEILAAHPQVERIRLTSAGVRGRARHLAAGSRLGFHAPYEIGAHGRMRPVNSAPERAAYRAAGLPRAFVARALAVPPAGIWIPDAAELRAAGIVTEIVEPDRFLDPARAPEPGASGSRTSRVPIREAAAIRAEPRQANANSAGP
ncbi:hypothetical protein [Methylobacterium sp. CM6257]